MTAYQQECEKACPGCAKGTARSSDGMYHRRTPFDSYFPCAAPTIYESHERLANRVAELEKGLTEILSGLGPAQLRE